MARPVAIALGYVAVLVAWIYGVVATDAYHDLWWMPLLAAVTVGAGFLVGRWWAVVLPFAAPLLAIPAGYPEDGGDSPLAVVVTAYLLFLVPLVAVGVGVRKWRDRGRS